MEIQKTFCTTKEEIESNKYNILIPICVGNKFFLEGTQITENVSKYIDWALRHTKEKILILIADKIQITNWVVRNKNNTLGTNLRRLKKMGEEIKRNFDEFIENLPKDEKEKIEVISWEDYDKKDPFCSGTTRLVYQEFKDNKEFQEEILDSVKSSIADREFSENEYWRLCNYVLDEFSLVYHGVNWKGDYYGLMIYPDVDSVVLFIENIKSGLKFKRLSERLYYEKIGVAILK